MATLTPIPTLDEVVERPASVAALPVALLHALLMRAVSVQTICYGALLAQQAVRVVQDDPDNGPQLLTAPEAAGFLRIALDTLYQAKDRFPYCTFRVPVGSRSMRYNRQRIVEYLRDPAAYRSMHAGSDPAILSGRRPRKAPASGAQRPSSSEARWGDRQP